MTTSRRGFLRSSVMGGGAMVLLPAGISAGDAATATAPGERAEDYTPGELRSDSESAKFREAAIHGDTAAVAAYLEADPGLLYARDEKDVSVFRLVVLAGQAEVAKLLRARGLVLDLFDAATAGDEARMGELYRQDPGIVRERTRFGSTALMCAAEGGSSPIVEFLMGRGADPNANVFDPKSGAPQGRTPLRMALDYPEKAAAEKMSMWLLGNGADPNAKQADGRPPLHAAAVSGYDRAVRMLLRKGAEANAKDAEGHTALEVAAKSGNPAADVLRMERSVARDQYTTRYLSGPGGQAPAAETDGIPQDFINRFVTVSHFDPQATRKLYTLCPALLQTRSTWNEMGIEGAAHVGTVPCAEFLLEKGAPLSICTAAMMGMSAHVGKLLLENPVRAAERGAHDFPPLLYTTFAAERVDIAEMLLGAGADPNAEMRGVTALHFAARKGYAKLSELLLAHGANPNGHADYPFLAEGTVLAVATKYGKEEIAGMVRARGGRME